jgi:hypothetical protein
MNLKSYAMRMNNLKRDLKKNQDTERDVNNLKKKLFYYQPKFKDWEQPQVLLNQNMKDQRKNFSSTNLSIFLNNLD